MHRQEGWTSKWPPSNIKPTKWLLVLYSDRNWRSLRNNPDWHKRGSERQKLWPEWTWISLLHSAKPRALRHTDLPSGQWQWWCGWWCGCDLWPVSDLLSKHFFPLISLKKGKKESISQTASISFHWLFYCQSKWHVWTFQFCNTHFNFITVILIQYYRRAHSFKQFLCLFFARL